MDRLPQWHDISTFLPARCNSILDVGCGDGRTLTLCPNIGFRAGIDYDPAAIRQARSTVPGGHFCVGSAEALPYPDGAFDAIVSCVALPYVDIPTAIRECSRVLRPGGVMMLSVHSWEFLNLLFRENKPNFTGRVFRVYVRLNGLFFHLTGRLFAYPFNRGVMESFQTDKRMVKVLAAAGFQEVVKLRRPISSFVATRRRTPDAR